MTEYPKFLGVGSRIRVDSDVDQDFGRKLMVIVEDGFCFLSIQSNTDVYGPGSCNLIPQATFGVLNYFYGDEEDWSKSIKESETINHCHSSIFHGAFDRGSNSAFDFFYSPITNVILGFQKSSNFLH